MRKKRKLQSMRAAVRLLLDLRGIWHNQVFSMERARKTCKLLFTFITGRAALLTIFATVAAAALASPFDLLGTYTKVSNEAPAPEVKILVVSIEPERCPPCRRLQPVIDSLKAKGYNVMTVGPHPTTRGFPTTYIFRDKKLVDTVPGFVDEDTLKDRIHDASPTSE